MNLIEVIKAYITFSLYNAIAKEYLVEIIDLHDVLEENGIKTIEDLKDKLEEKNEIQ